MRTHRVALTVLLMLVFAFTAILTGCANQTGAGEDSPVVLPGVNGEVYSSQPVNQPSEQAPEQRLEPPVAPEPSRKPATQAPGVELGPPPAEAGPQQNGEKVVYLTFDDGPNSDYTEKVLDVLHEKNVKATFMVIGKNVEFNPGVLQRILAEGHGVGNHTYGHDYNTLYSSPDGLLADLEKNNQVLARYTGEAVMIMRPPGGPQNLKPEFKSLLEKSGYTSVGWNVTSGDSDPNGVTQNQVYNNIVSGLERIEQMKRTPIILMHDGTQLGSTAATARPGSSLARYIQSREATLGALPAVIDHLAAKGYTFKIVDENTPPAW